MSFEIPAACTLPTAERPLRLAEFHTLFAASLRGLDRMDATHLRLTLGGDAGVESATRDLVTRESACCSFFDFAVTATGQAVVLDIRVPAGQVAVLDGLAAFATEANRATDRQQ
jgi:hypothetical protein